MAGPSMSPLLAPATERLASVLRHSPLFEPVRERLRPFAGRSLRIGMGGLVMGFRVGDEGDLLAADPATPDLRLDIPPDRMLRRALGDVRAFEGLAFEGDAALGQALAAIARDLHWDWPSALETVLPPPFAAPLGLFAARAQAAWRDAGVRIGDAARDYLHHESGSVSPTEMKTFLDGVDDLREALDRIEARLGRLQRQP